MQLVSKNISHGASALGSTTSEYALASIRSIPRDYKIPHHPVTAACPLEDVASTSSNVDEALGLGSLRHLENSWAGSPFGRRPWVLRVSVDEKPQRTRNKEKTPAFFANVGDAIRSLREDIPGLFEKDLNYDIYTENIIFKDPNVSFQGMKNYKTMFWSLRFHGKIFFKQLYVEVKRIWQPKDMEIKMRWTVHGVPRLFGDKESLFDGISTYSLDENGRIYEHSVNNVLLRDTPAFSASPILAGIDRALAGPTPQPYPGAWGISLDSMAVHPADNEGVMCEQASHCDASAGAVLRNSSPAAVWFPIVWCLMVSLAMGRAQSNAVAVGPLQLSNAAPVQGSKQSFQLEGLGA